jgi:phage tail-like protein
MGTDSINEGGENLYTHRVPSRINYNNLVLERGMVIGSPLNLEFNAAFSLFRFAPSNVLVTLFSEKSIPLAGWMFIKAYPVKWSVSDLDATESAVVIDTMELAYTRFQIIRV